MKTYSPSASPASSARADENHLRLRLLALGAVCGLAGFAAFPQMTRYWIEVTEFGERCRIYQNAAFAPLPNEAPARQLAGWNAH